MRVQFHRLHGSRLEGSPTFGATAFTFGGGGGSGATGISVSGWAISTLTNFKACLHLLRIQQGHQQQKCQNRNLRNALKPSRFQFGFASGKRARRAGIGLLPMCCFQASGARGSPWYTLNPTPIEVLRGGSAIIVVIRLPPRADVYPDTSVPKGTEVVKIGTCVVPVREYFGGRVLRIGLSYYRRVLANVFASALSTRLLCRVKPAEAEFVAGGVRNTP